MASGQSSRLPRSPAAALALIVAVALAVRIYNLDGRSLWLDEIRTALYAHFSSPADVIERAVTRVNQMPLFFLFTWLLGPIGDNEFVLRLPAAIFGTLCVPAVFVLAQRLFGVRVALIASILTTVLPIAVWFSQDARPYSLLMLLTVLQMYYAYRAVTDMKVWYWLGLAAATSLNVYTHYVAWAPTVAVAAYITAFIFRDFVRAGRWPWVAGATLIGGAGAATLVTRGGRAYARSAHQQLEHITSLPFWSTLAGIALLVAAVSVVAIAYWWLPRRKALPAFARRLEMAAAGALLVALTYVPWLGPLLALTNQSNQTVDSLQPARTITFTGLLAQLQGLDLWGIGLVLFGIGIFTLAIWSFRGRAAESALVLAWLAVPVLGFIALVGARIAGVDQRYFSFLFPAAVIAIACGVEGIAMLADEVGRRVGVRLDRRPWLVQTGTALVVTSLLLVQLVPALASSYSTPNNDYRAAARYIAAASEPGSTVLALGTYSDWAADAMIYYLGQLNHTMPVIDSPRMTGDSVEDLTTRSGTVWGILAFPSPDEVASGDVGSAFVDVTGTIHVVRTSEPNLTPIDQASRMLRWDIPHTPELSAPLKLLDLIQGQAQLGPDLVGESFSDGWYLTAGASPELDTLVMSPNAAQPEVDAIYTKAIAPGDFIVKFSCRNSSLSGWQRIYAVAIDARSHPIDNVPEGDPFDCPSATDWAHSYFSFTAPPGTTGVQLILKAHGSGVAQFGIPELRTLNS